MKIDSVTLFEMLLLIEKHQVRRPFRLIFEHVVDFIKINQKDLVSAHRFPLAHYKSKVHGLAHWYRVCVYEFFLLEMSHPMFSHCYDRLLSRELPTPTSDEDELTKELNKLTPAQYALLLCAVFHDICRCNDIAEKTHGGRGALLFLDFVKHDKYVSLRLDEAAIDDIVFALKHHSSGVRAYHPQQSMLQDAMKVSCVHMLLCNADRLDRVRVEVVSPKEMFLYTTHMHDEDAEDEISDDDESDLLYEKDIPSAPTSSTDCDEDDLSALNEDEKYICVVDEKTGKPVRRRRKYKHTDEEARLLKKSDAEVDRLKTVAHPLVASLEEFEALRIEYPNHPLEKKISVADSKHEQDEKLLEKLPCLAELLFDDSVCKKWKGINPVKLFLRNSKPPESLYSSSMVQNSFVSRLLCLHLNNEKFIGYTDKIEDTLGCDWEYVVRDVDL
ncbi:hypothetical protein ADUPG1_013128 [Aduncisulcus paluster]|uniref:HD domain-containing protein n=1 Tax=Aduncisulcus paluster TaxID=2918883 RepID=A0ABQ5K6L1_9EUKA|nr:hypothetical protein ADUPG1_013128 [Aduncisulcus paluster]